MKRLKRTKLACGVSVNETKFQYPIHALSYECHLRSPKLVAVAENKYCIFIRVKGSVRGIIFYFATFKILFSAL